ncbi:putative ephrin type-A receptor 5 [Apostichopus japonicus]|uniref:Putative ephrin type-A receptor 5 n=1 Tax=Stichopus japonicus TaxID=307972 RepID=A0A2G8LK72_STIJA|nr:putative ephrin type-A receptor 5 [Apostichopus japonicus]
MEDCTTALVVLTIRSPPIGLMRRNRPLISLTRVALSPSPQSLPLNRMRWSLVDPLFLTGRSTRSRFTRSQELCSLVGKGGNTAKGLKRPVLGKLRSCPAFFVLTFTQSFTIVFTDIVFRSKDITWNVFVKRILELPDSEYLVKIEGICIDQACLYLISEHLVCDTLETLLMNQFHSYTKKRVLDVLLDIARGIEVIHAFGFVHPGFSTKKILVCENGKCKLYNFCLLEDSSRIVRIKKSMGSMSLNDLPPEALQRNEYSSASDIWSTAVVMWQIISPGCVPFKDDKVRLEHSYKFALDDDEQIQLRDNLLQNCFSEDPSARPTIQTIRHLAQKLMSSTDVYENKHEKVNVEVNEAYVPMGKAVVAKETYI